MLLDYLPRVTRQYFGSAATASTFKPMAIAMIAAEMASHMCDLPRLAQRATRTGGFSSMEGLDFRLC
jgi:hypothetical protein